MRKRYIALIFIASALAALAFVVFTANKPIKLNLEKVEIADSPEEMEKGYMGRTDICDKCGMLFVFGSPQQVSFWMKDTPTSLDIVMMKSDGTITDIYRSTEPNSEKMLPSSSDKVAYVLEVKSGGASNLSIGQRIDIDQLKSTSR